MLRTILLIEDEKEFAKLVSAYLKKKNFAVTHVSLGRRGLEKLRENTYDVVILDLGLPDEDGLKLCQKIREKETVPILILTAREEIENKVTGLNLGADDYLVKPVSLKELAVRINRLLRRDLKDTFRSAMFRFGGIKFDTITGRLAFNKKTVSLTKKEKAVLEYLILKKGQALTRIQIMEHVWGKEIDVFSNTVNMVISSLRKKLQFLSKSQFIYSVRGLGYKFEEN